MGSLLTKLRSSIFLKLFFVLLITGLLISFASTIGFLFSDRPRFDPRTHAFLEQYVRYLAADLGEPPNFEKGKELADKLNIGIRVEGNGWSWASSPDVPPIQPGSATHRSPSFPFWRPPPHGHVAVVDYSFPQGPAKVLIHGHRREHETNVPLLCFLVGFILLILIGCYFVIRWILSPIRSLSKGVAEVGAGNLNYEVRTSSCDELGRLSAAFNQMTARVREMLQTRQQLLIDVSHELRSPLTRAKVGLELVEQSEPIQHIAHDLGELEAMIEELLESARLGSGKGLSVEEVDLAAVIRACVDQYVDFGESVHLKTSSEKIMARVDADRIQCVMRNLIENALKYSSGLPVEVRVTEEGSNVRIAVEDKGGGIPAAELQHVFEPFYRIDKSRSRKTGGFGLGLSLCKRIAEAHGGTIRLESNAGAGTTALLFLPK